MKLNFENRFVQLLPADPETKNTRRQVHGACYSLVEPTKVASPSLVSVSPEAAELLDLTEEDCQTSEFLEVMVGNKLLDGMQPYAMCYGGHQFGNWAGQLGDGRAINLGEVKNAEGDYWSLQLKGSGATPYSRSADGLAVLRSSIREYLCSEAMFHLGVPTTRALSLALTGESVMRDMLYDGHPEYEPGAVVCRIAPSFIRFGNFQIFAARKELKELRSLTEFTIRHHFPDIVAADETIGVDEISRFFDQVCQLTVGMIVEWMRVGFVHGVMNTDNMSILGLTIDYGPYGWLDNFDPDWTPNTTDAQGKRYRFSQQPNVALWNLYQLANALYPLTDETERFEASLERFQSSYQEQFNNMMLAKLGLLDFQGQQDQRLIEELTALISEQETDMTIFFRLLAVNHDFNHSTLLPAFYEPDAHSEEYVLRFEQWLERYSDRASLDNISPQQRMNAMNRVNPKYVFRNYLAQQAIEKSEAGDHSMVNELLNVFRRPYDEQTEYEHYAQKRPEWAKTKVGCSMLSCSS